MKIKIISAHCLGGGRDVWPGDIVEVDEATARRKVRQGFAIEYVEPAMPVATERVPMPPDAGDSEPEQPSGGEPDEHAEAPSHPSRGRGRSRG